MTHRQYKCLLTIFQMLEDRNYEIVHSRRDDDKKQTDSIDHMLQQQIVLRAFNKRNPKQKLAVIFPPEIKLGVAVAREYIKQFLEEDPPILWKKELPQALAVVFCTLRKPRASRSHPPLADS